MPVVRAHAVVDDRVALLVGFDHGHDGVHHVHADLGCRSLQDTHQVLHANKALGIKEQARAIRCLTH